MAYTTFSSSGSTLYNGSTSAPTLSLQEAFPNRGYGGIQVFLGSCNSTGFQNCTASCLDASVLFSGLEIFHNCLIYPAVAGLYANGSLGDAHLADSLGINDKSQETQAAETITSQIYDCLSNYCGDDERCSTDLQENSAFTYGNQSTTNGFLDYFPYPSIYSFDICDYVAPFSFLNADIGGVGVSMNPT